MPILKDQSEKSFDTFLEQEAYEDTEGALFKLVRSAFMAGYEASKNENRRLEINSTFCANAKILIK